MSPQEQCLYEAMYAAAENYSMATYEIRMK
jgi:hypothetical protein